MVIFIITSNVHWGVQWVRYHSKHFTSIFSFFLHDNHVRLSRLLSLFHRWGKRSTESWCNVLGGGREALCLLGSLYCLTLGLLCWALPSLGGLWNTGLLFFVTPPWLCGWVSRRLPHLSTSISGGWVPQDRSLWDTESKNPWPLFLSSAPDSFRDLQNKCSATPGKLVVLIAVENGGFENGDFCVSLVVWWMMWDAGKESSVGGDSWGGGGR